LQAIREEIVQGYVSSTLAAGFKPKTVKNHLLLLKTVLRHAIRWGYLASNPAAEVKPPRVEREEMKILTPQQVVHLLTATTEKGEPAIPPGWYIPIKVAIFSGLRLGEEFALHVGDLDFHAGQVRVQRALTVVPKRYTNGGPRYLITSPESRSSIRNVDLPSDLLKDLRAYVGGLPDPDPNGLLFPSSAGGHLSPNVVRAAFKQALQNAKLPDMRWHDLRHTYASLQIAAGANIKYLSQQLGHASVQITLDRYSHLLRDTHPDQAARLSRLVFEPNGATGSLPGEAQPGQKNGEQEGKRAAAENGLTTHEERPERSTKEDHEKP
jgi:integrase